MRLGTAASGPPKSGVTARSRSRAGRYTPRVIATALLRDDAIRFAVGYFVFTLLFALRVSIRMDAVVVSQFNVFLAAVLGSSSIVVFLFLIDHAARPPTSTFDSATPGGATAAAE